jgi:hypothetical protein
MNSLCKLKEEQIIMRYYERLIEGSSEMVDSEMFGKKNISFIKIFLLILSALVKIFLFLKGNIFVLS